jgi:hypothetical protein
MKKLSVDLASVTKQSYLNNIGWINKFIRLWGTTNVNGEEVLLSRRYFYSNTEAAWCRARGEDVDKGDWVEPAPCEPEFTKEEAKAKNQTWYPTYFAPYYTKKDSNGNYSTDEDDLGMEVFRFLNIDKDLASTKWKRSQIKYAWFLLNPDKLAELEATTITSLLNAAVKQRSVSGKLTLQVMIDLNGDLLTRTTSCEYLDAGYVACKEQAIDALAPYKAYTESTTKDLGKMYKDYEVWFKDNFEFMISSNSIIDSSDEIPYLRPIAMYAFSDMDRVKITDVKRIPVVVPRQQTYTDEISGFYEDVNVVKNTLTVTFELNTYQLDQSVIYSRIIEAATAKRISFFSLNNVHELVKKYLASSYVPDEGEMTEAESMEFIGLNNSKTQKDADMWLYDPSVKRYHLRVSWLRNGLMGDGSIVKAKKRIDIVQKLLDMDYKKQSQSTNWIQAIIIIVIVVIINYACNGCLTDKIATMIAAEVGVSTAVAAAVAYTIVISTALNLVAVVASLLGMYQLAMSIQSFLKTIQPIVILATIIYAYAAIAQRFAAERAADAAMQATETQVASMGGSTFEFVPRTNIEIAVDLVKDSVSSTINNFTSSITNFSDFSSMTYDKAIKMIDTSTKVAMQIYENYAKTEMKKLSDEMKSIQQENAELAEATEKSELSINLLIATQNAAFNNLTNDMSKDVSMFDTPYMPAIRLGHIGNTQTTSAIALMGEAGDNYMNRYY